MKTILQYSLSLSRLAAIIPHLLSALLIVATYRRLLGKSWYNKPAGQRIIRRWCRLTCMITGLRIRTSGKPLNGLLVANHVSWLDIVALNAIEPVRFISKDDVIRWPVIGKLASASGTFFLQRGSARAARASMQTVTTELANGSSVVLFPEGTTSDGQGILPFHKTFFQAAIDAGTIVQPVVLTYCRNGRLDEHAPYINKTSFLSHFLQFTRHLGSTLNITCLSPLEAGDCDRKALSEAARRVIVNAHAEMTVSAQVDSEHIEPGDCLGYERGA